MFEAFKLPSFSLPKKKEQPVLQSKTSTPIYSKQANSAPKQQVSASSPSTMKNVMSGVRQKIASAVGAPAPTKYSTSSQVADAQGPGAQKLGPYYEKPTPSNPTPMAKPQKLGPENPGIQQQPQQQQPQQQPQPDTSYIDDYLAEQKRIAGERMGMNDQAYRENQEVQRQLLELQRSDLMGARGDAEKALSGFKESTQATIGDLLASGTRQKQAGEEALGTAQRRAAADKRRTDALRQAKFAQLGTLDSYGAQGYTGQQTEADQEYSLGNRNMEAEFARKSADIDSQVESSVRNAYKAIQDEEMKFNALVRNIDSSLARGSMEHQQAMNQAYREYQNNILGMQDYISQVQQQASDMKRQLQQQAKQLADSDPFANLSQEFLQTGQPTPQDRVFLLKNPEMAKAYKDVFAGPQGNAGKQISGELATNLASFDASEELLNDLNKTINDNREYFGASANLFSPADRSIARNEKSASIDAQIRAVRQMVGTALEGGKLAAGDDVKYAAMLPQIGDEPNVALNKIANIKRMLSQRKQATLNTLSQSGYSAPQGSSAGIDPAVAQFLQSQGF